MRNGPRVGVVVLVCGAILLGYSWTTKAHGQLPGVANAYGNWLAYWGHVATALRLYPTEGQIGEWMLSYDEQGKVQTLHLVIYVDRREGQCDVYNINQGRTGKAVWNRHSLDCPSSIIAVPARQFFQELNAVGYRQLEINQAITPPIRSSFSTIAGTITYGPQVRTYLIKDGRITPAGAEGVTMRGIHGSLQLIPDIASGRSSNSPPFYLMPAVGCFPERTTGNEQAHVWQCAEYP